VYPKSRISARPLTLPVRLIDTKKPRLSGAFCEADDEARTRDLRLGKAS